MPDGRFALIDPAAGVSGDMLLGALIAVGAAPDWLHGLPARLGIPEVTVEIEPAERCGIQATKVYVTLPGGRREGPADAGDHHGHVHGGEHGHGGHHHGHRRIGDLIAMVERAPLSEWVRSRATQAFQLLGEAEGRVHGQPADEVVLHEVGALDALVDIVGAIEGFEQLGADRIHTRPLAVGSGWVNAAHGVLPVPAPATAILLEGLEIGPEGPVEGEATTPTGAVLLRVLTSGSAPEQWRPVASGWGAGGRNPTGYPNALRIWLGEPASEAQEVVILATDVDDLSPEYLEPLREALTRAGALDVSLWSTQMKKGRTGFRIEVIVPPSRAGSVADALFRHSTTAGVRQTRAGRITLPRHELTLDYADGQVRVKVLRGPDGPRYKPEFEDVAAAARRSGRAAHEVARELQVMAESFGTPRPSIRED